MPVITHNFGRVGLLSHSREPEKAGLLMAVQRIDAVAAAAVIDGLPALKPRCPNAGPEALRELAAANPGLAGAKK